jgi:tetratricopeptide (TPR) repeat protein
MRTSSSIPALALTLLALPASPETPLEQGYRHLYNLQFAEAHSTFQDWSRAHPDDPMGPVSDAATYLFAEFDRLHILQSEFFTHDQHFLTDHKLAPDLGLKRQFEAAIETTRKLAARAPADPGSQLASVMASGLRSNYLALIDHQYVASFREMKTARLAADKLLKEHPELCDAWIAAGVENYMLSVKPAPVRWLLRLAGGETDRTLGIEKLRLAADKGHYLAPFARLLLGVAALRDHNPAKAREVLNGLIHEYPSNPLYREELARLQAGSASLAGAPR